MLPQSLQSPSLPSSYPQLLFQPKPDYVKGKEMIPNAFSIHKTHRKASTLDRILCTCIPLHFILLHVYFQLDLANQPSIHWLVASALCGVLISIILIARHISRNEFMGKIKEQPQSVLELVACLVVVLVMPYPFLQDITLYFNVPGSPLPSYDFKLNYLLTCLSCLRFPPLAASIIANSKYLRPRSYRTAKMNNFSANLLTALQSYFKDRPFWFILNVFIGSILLFSFAQRIAQCKYLSDDFYSAYSNVIWMTAITMTTVGFGDMSPVTPIGRIVAGLCASWGVLIVAVMVVVLSNILSLNSKETQSLLILKKLQNKETIREAAGLYLTSSLWRLWQNHKYKLNKRENLGQRKLKLAFSTLRKKRFSQSKEDLALSFQTEINREFNRVSDEIAYLIKNNINLMNYLSEQVIFYQGRNQKRFPSCTSIVSMETH